MALNLSELEKLYRTMNNDAKMIRELSEKRLDSSAKARMYAEQVSCILERIKQKCEQIEFLELDND